MAAGNDRRCVVTRQSGPRHGMIRFAVSPDGVLTPDLAETLPGRGIWVVSSGTVLASKDLARAASRSCRGRVTVPDALPETVERLLVQRCQATLGLARRSGAVDTGFEKVRAAVVSGAARLMLTARDSGGRDGQELARRAAAQPAAVRISTVLDASELGAAFGRERQVHVAVAGGALADRLIRDLERLEGFRPAPVNEAHEGEIVTNDAAADVGGDVTRDKARGR